MALDIGWADINDAESLSIYRNSVFRGESPTSYNSPHKFNALLRRTRALARAIGSSWCFEHASYQCAPDIEATWFIDPPYQRSFDQYAAKPVDYVELWKWIGTRRGQIILCEAADNDWIPEPVNVVHTVASGLAGGRPRGGPRVEVMWHRPG